MNVNRRQSRFEIEKIESLCVKEASRREGDDRLVFVLQITVKDEERELKKRLSDIRSLFHQICALFPMLITPVPYPEDIDSEKDLEKAKSEVETYLQGLLECKNLGPLYFGVHPEKLWRYRRVRTRKRSNTRSHFRIGNLI